MSRRLASRGYFDLIGGLTDLIDSAVIVRRGIVGKHAGDGGSALFLALDFSGSESAAARAAIEGARAIRDGAAVLGPDELSVKVNIGLHWGGTLMVGQVATNGRLEVTALGDAMNEGARIEAAARAGSILASKELIERLAPHDVRNWDRPRRDRLRSAGGARGRKREGRSGRWHDSGGGDLTGVSLNAAATLLGAASG